MVAGSGATMCTRSGRSFQSCRNASLSMPQMDHPGCPAQGGLVSVSGVTPRPQREDLTSDTIDEGGRALRLMDGRHQIVGSTQSQRHRRCGSPGVTSCIPSR